MPFHLNSTVLGEGSVIQPGNWGRIIRTYGWIHNRAIFETAMEYVRLTAFSHLPSRLDCAFFFDSLSEAQGYRNSDQSRQMMVIYEVEVIDKAATQHRTDYRNAGASGALDLGWINDYWAGNMKPPINGFNCQETLAVTSLKIVRAI
jgi:hypothetical protein